MVRIDNPDKVKSAINTAPHEKAKLVNNYNAQADEIRALCHQGVNIPWHVRTGANSGFEAFDG
ncbi:hypothetical protein NP537_24040 [Pseudomonas kurunegalensis]|nr:hypothetical protein [Pseudomonas kurunegalensis]